MNPAAPSTSQTIPPARDSEKGIVSIAVSQFGVAFSFNCIMSFMPFYILKISEYGTKETMLWIGLIMGVSPLVTAAAAPFWGSLTTRVRPKLLYQAGTFFNGVIFLLMGFAGSLPLILFLRLCQGFLGGISTIGLVLIASSSPEKRCIADVYECPHRGALVQAQARCLLRPAGDENGDDQALSEGRV